MIKAIRERGPQLKAEKIAKANSDLEKAKLKAIQIIEQELEDRGLKIEDLEEEYHNYKEKINSLSKKPKIRSYEDKVMEAIRQKSQGGRFETKQGEQSGQLDKPKQTGLPLSDDKKIDREMKPVEYEKLQIKNLTENMDYKNEKKKENLPKKDDKKQAKNFDSAENTSPEFHQQGTNLKNNKSTKNYSLSKFQTVENIESQTGQRKPKPTLLVIGIVLIIASVLAAGYLLGKNKGGKKAI